MSHKIVKTIIEERQVDGWDHLRDRIRVAFGAEPLDEWSWYKKPEPPKSAVHFGKIPHFTDAFYATRTTPRKRSKPDIHSVTKIERYAPKLVLDMDEAPADRPKVTFKSVKKVAKNKVPEPVVNEEQTTATIEEFE